MSLRRTWGVPSAYATANTYNRTTPTTATRITTRNCSLQIIGL